MASAVDSRLAYARLSAVATASRLPTANRGSNNSYTTSWDTTVGHGEASMSGADYGRSNQAVTGTAMLDIADFANPDVDIAFTGISGGRADMAWSNLSVTDDTF